MSNLLLQAKESFCQIKIANLTYDPTSKVLSSEASDIELEPRNLELLEMLLTHVGEPISNDQIIEEIWDSKYISKNVVTNRVSTLRTLLKDHLTDIDPTKLIVTYPKKGYFIPTNLVSVVERECVNSKEECGVEDAVILECQTPIHASESEKPRNRLLWGSLSALVILMMSIIIVVFTLHAEKTATNDSIFIPQVQLLLNKIQCRDDQAKPYLIAIKAMILRSQAAYQYTELTNLHSPGYFLQRIDSSCRWPGSLNNSSQSDFQLSLNIWKAEDAELHVEALLYRSASNKVAWRNIYSATPDTLHLLVHQMTQDFADYFQLPKPILPPEQLLMSNFTVPPENIVWPNLKAKILSDNEIYFFSRELLFSDVSSDEVGSWVAKIKRVRPVPEPELHIWLALLTYKSGQVERSLDMLNREYVAELADNALIYLLKANLNYKVGDIASYQSNYLRSMSALTAVLPPQKIIDHYRYEFIPQSCVALWQEVLSNQGKDANRKVITENVGQFCQSIL